MRRTGFIISLVTVAALGTLSLLAACGGGPASQIENRSPGELGARVVEVIEAMYRSAASGRRTAVGGRPWGQPRA